MLRDGRIGRICVFHRSLVPIVSIVPIVPASQLARSALQAAPQNETTGTTETNGTSDNLPQPNTLNQLYARAACLPFIRHSSFFIAAFGGPSPRNESLRLQVCL